MHSKSVVTVLPTPRPHWVGDGFLVRPLFGNLAFTAAPSPFLMFDWAAPVDFPPATARRGVGPHPHRGFETVTIVYAGEVEHRDSAGYAGKIGPGDVQWMTAGSGVLHEEMHSLAATRAGGPVSMAQLWVNLPAAHKMTAPRYQPIEAKDIPTVRSGGAEVRVIAGSLDDAEGTTHRGPAATFTPLSVWDGRLAAESRFEAPLPQGWRTLVAVLAGEVEVGGRRISADTVAILDDEAGRVTLTAGAADVRFLVLAGEPIDEPIAHYGPFVMNTRAELQQAFDDFNNGAMGDLTGS
jgi:quercetin 2,3-dioxygenase